MRISFWLVAAVLVCLGACQSPEPLVTGPKVDSGPEYVPDPDKIPGARPQPVTWTRAGNKSPYQVLGKTYEVLPDSRGFVQEGTASWYGRKFHGRLTSNGERFDMYGLTAAHKNLPIPVYAEITNLQNGRKLIVRINDRGPFHGDRVIDLSWAAAAKLGFSEQGTAPVRIVTLDPDTAALPGIQGGQAGQDALVSEPGEPAPIAIPSDFRLPGNSFYQIAAMSSAAGAQKLASEIEAYTKYPVRVMAQPAAGTSVVHRVMIGPLADRREVNTLSLILELTGMSPGFVVTP